MSSIERQASKVYLYKPEISGPAASYMGVNYSPLVGLGGKDDWKSSKVGNNKYSEAPSKVAVAFAKMEWLAAFMASEFQRL
jgi:hypothetical protein